MKESNDVDVRTISERISDFKIKRIENNISVKDFCIYSDGMSPGTIYSYESEQSKPSYFRMSFMEDKLNQLIKNQ